MGSVKDIWEIITGVFRKRTPAEYKQWQDITRMTIDELHRSYDDILKENERLKAENADLKVQVDHYKKSKSRGAYE